MRHRTQSGFGKQIPLAFNPMASVDGKAILRSAYTRLELSRRLSFEQVMSNRAYAIGVRNLADAMARRRTSGISRKSNSGANAVAENMDPGPDLRPGIDYPGAEEGKR
jgi:hypothetical protein